MKFANYFTAMNIEVCGGRVGIPTVQKNAPCGFIRMARSPFVPSKAAIYPVSEMNQVLKRFEPDVLHPARAAEVAENLPCH